MPKADEFDSAVMRATNPLNAEKDSRINAAEDSNQIIQSVPEDLRRQVSEIYQEIDRKFPVSLSENGKNAKALAEIENKSPEVIEALKEITYRKAFARSAYLKDEIARLSKDDQFKDVYETAMKAASKAFNTADEVAKSVLKRGDDTYGDTREYRGLALPDGDVYESGNTVATLESPNSKEQTFTLAPGSPYLSGRVIAVNTGILAARNAAEKVIKDLSKQYEKVNMPLSRIKAEQIRRLITEKMVSDKHAFLAVKGYIPKTSIYIGPVSEDHSPVATIDPRYGNFRTAGSGKNII
jgi:hypothetical protein